MKEETFKTLKQVPFSEIAEKLDLGINNKEKFYPDYLKFQERMALLEDNGWEYKDFALALERQLISKQIAEYNFTLQPPTHLIARALLAFPNARFTPAKIELD